MRGEIIKLLGIMKTAYPRFYANMKKDEANATIDLWTQMLCDIEPQLLVNAVKGLIAVSPFPPTIADIRKKAADIQNYGKDEDNAMKAWELVKKAVSCVYYNSVEEFVILPPLCRRVVGSPSTLKEWGLIDIETFNTVTQSNFLRAYRAIAEKEKEFEQLPKAVQEFAAYLAQGTDVKQLCGEEVRGKDMV